MGTSIAGLTENTVITENTQLLCDYNQTTHRLSSDNFMIELWLKMELWTVLKWQLLDSCHLILLLYLYSSIFKMIVCESWLWADLGLPTIHVCLSVLCLSCVCCVSTTALFLNRFWVFSGIGESKSVLLTLFACWALADRLTASLFIVFYTLRPFCVQKCDLELLEAFWYYSFFYGLAYIWIISL